jgi:hypothetical protein
MEIFKMQTTGQLPIIKSNTHENVENFMVYLVDLRLFRHGVRIHGQGYNIKNKTENANFRR